MGSGSQAVKGAVLLYKEVCTNMVRTVEKLLVGKRVKINWEWQPKAGRSVPGTL